jgi:hypothetical protein
MIWTLIGKSLRSRYRITKPAADEMAKHADLVLRQYLGPVLADNAPLALYALTQFTALAAAFTLREPAQPVPKSAASAPASSPHVIPREPAPPSAYESGPREDELHTIVPAGA